MIAVPASDLAVVYHLYGQDPQARNNFEWFVTLGLCDPVDTYVMLTDSWPAWELPQRAGISYHRRRNHNWDYGAYADALKLHVPWHRYHGIIFMYHNLRGPFSREPWAHRLWNLRRADTGILGLTINVLSDHGQEGQEYHRRWGSNPPWSHVQTPLFVLDRDVIGRLIRQGFWDRAGTMTKIDSVVEFEIRMSQLILSWGLNLQCVLPGYDLDYRQPHQDPNPTSWCGDPRWPGAYWNSTINPQQAMFATTNRGLYLDTDLDQLCRDYHGTVTR